MSDKQLNISIEQAKLLGNALRIKIISQLLDKPKTAKQVADLLGHSAGNVHYHIRKLYEGGLLELVKEKQFGGVTEKYYKSKAKWFHSHSTEVIDPVLKENFNSNDSTALSIRLNLTTEQQVEMKEELKVLLERWVEKTSVNEDEWSFQEFSIGIRMISTKQKDDHDKKDGNDEIIFK